jgi:PAS domain S-box-containing protein
VTDREGALRLALDAAGMGTWVWRRSTDALEWDARMESLFGLEPGEFAGTVAHWQELLHPDDRDRVRLELDVATSAGANFSVVHRVAPTRAAVRWVESWGRAFVDETTGEVAGARGVAVDVTERKVVEAELERTHERLALLARSGILLASSLELEQTLKNLGRVVVPVLADACEVVLVDASVPGEPPRLRRFVIAVDDDKAALREMAPIPDVPRHPIRRVLESNTPELIRVSASPEDFGPADVPTSARALGVKAAVLEPIRIRGEVRGVFVASWFREPPDMDERCALIPDLAVRAALAIDNSRLFQAHRETSITLQRALLPDDLAIPPGFRIATRYHPGFAGVEVGGDWYDATIGRSGYLEASVGDVVGQGVRAAAAMVRIRTALRTLMFDRTPAQAITDLAEHRAIVTAGFVTVLAVSIRGDGRTRITCAGHLPPILVEHGKVEVVETLADSALGIPSTRPYQQIERDLAPGSRLVMYTDGLVERRRVALDVGIETLRNVVIDGATLDLEDLADQIFDRMLGDDAHDDVALMIVELPATLT